MSLLLLILRFVWTVYCVCINGNVTSKCVLTSPTSGCRSVGIVRSRTEAIFNASYTGDSISFESLEAPAWGFMQQPTNVSIQEYRNEQLNSWVFCLYITLFPLVSQRRGNSDNLPKIHFGCNLREAIFRKAYSSKVIFFPTGSVFKHQVINGPSTQQFLSSSSDVIATICFVHTTIIRRNTLRDYHGNYNSWLHNQYSNIFQRAGRKTESWAKDNFNFSG
jgi:hypothetical protein